VLHLPGRVCRGRRGDVPALQALYVA
jgi:hypothetical protein